MNKIMNKIMSILFLFISINSFSQEIEPIDMANEEKSWLEKYHEKRKIKKEAKDNNLLKLKSDELSEVKKELELLKQEKIDAENARKKALEAKNEAEKLEEQNKELAKELKDQKNENDKKAKELEAAKIAIDDYYNYSIQAKEAELKALEDKKKADDAKEKALVKAKKASDDAKKSKEHARQAESKVKSAVNEANKEKKLSKKEIEKAKALQKEAADKIEEANEKIEIAQENENLATEQKNEIIEQQNRETNLDLSLGLGHTKLTNQIPGLKPYLFLKNGVSPSLFKQYSTPGLQNFSEYGFSGMTKKFQVELESLENGAGLILKSNLEGGKDDHASLLLGDFQIGRVDYFEKLNKYKAYFYFGTDVHYMELGYQASNNTETEFISNGPDNKQVNENKTEEFNFQLSQVKAPVKIGFEKFGYEFKQGNLKGLSINNKSSAGLCMLLSGSNINWNADYEKTEDESVYDPSLNIYANEQQKYQLSENYQEAYNRFNILYQLASSVELSYKPENKGFEFVLSFDYSKSKGGTYCETNSTISAGVKLGEKKLIYQHLNNHINDTGLGIDQGQTVNQIKLSVPLLRRAKGAKAQ